MFTLDATIDAVQNGKKTFVNTFVQNEAVAKALNNFVDAQSEYTKKAVKVTNDTATVVAQEAVKSYQALAKVNLVKMSEDFYKMVSDLQKTATKAYSKKAD